MMPRELYSRRAKLDLRLSMAAALKGFLETLTFSAGGRPLKFARVYEEWAGWTDKGVQPAASVLPDEQIEYGKAPLTPSLIDGTWEPHGQAGWGLYQLSMAECDMEISIRANSSGERSAVMAVMETAFVEDGAGSSYERGRRYGRIIPMPDYYGLNARFTLLSSRVLDDGDSAMKNRNEASMVVSAQAPLARVDVVQPFIARVTEVLE